MMVLFTKLISRNGKEKTVVVLNQVSSYCAKKG
jgi:hypothetical protein